MFGIYHRMQALLNGACPRFHFLATFDFVELAHARHSPSKLGSALA